jgi:hypothetical protein
MKSATARGRLEEMFTLAKKNRGNNNKKPIMRLLFLHPIQRAIQRITIINPTAINGITKTIPLSTLKIKE